MALTITTNAQLSMVTDLQTALNKAGSDPTSFVEMNGYLYFTANEPSIGIELWRTNGTLAGTELVKDIKAGSGSSNPSNLFVYKGALYFQADDGVVGTELWKSDGTANGTELLIDIYTGSAGKGGFNSSSPKFFVSFNNLLFFQARNSNGTELWKTDGSDSNTVMVKDIYTGTSGKTTNSSFPTNFIVFNSALYFQAASNNVGTELWKTDGTTAGTVIFKDINTGTSGSDPKSMIELNGVLYFVASTTANGDELWKTDGTAGNTVIVKDICVGATGSSINFLTKFNNKLYFSADNGVVGAELWTSDGTLAGTQLFKNINSVLATSPSYPSTLTVFNGKLMFTADDGFDGFELWSSDGTLAGTTELKDIFTGGSSSPDLFTVVNTSMFFVAQNSGVGNELWKTDGTKNGTVMVKDIYSGANSSDPRYLTTLNNLLIFGVDDGLNGREPWKSDGTLAGTVMVRDIITGTKPSSPSQLVSMKGKLYFTAESTANGNELFASDGTKAGTSLVKEIMAGVYSAMPKHLINVNDVLFFSADDSKKGYELWKSNGTAAGTMMVKDINTDIYSSEPDSFCNVNGILYFTADDGINGFELWKSDGTAAGTVMVKDIYPGMGTSSANSSNPYGLVNVNGTLYFRANDGVNATELWKSNGTAAGTVMIKDIITGTASSEIEKAFNYNGVLLFQADDGTNGVELWKSDGTAAGTVMVKHIYTGTGWGGGANSSNPQYFTLLNGKVYFQATSSIGTELWQTDGTDLGTTLVKDINVGTGWGGANSSNPQNLTKVGSEIFFSATTKTEGTELWKTNGTTAGTVLMKNINPGSKSSNPNNLLADEANSALYFVANDGVNGSELWKAENNSCGKTQITGEINPGNAGTGPTNLCMMNNVLYFSASDALYSTELWKYINVYTFADTGLYSYTICDGDSILFGTKYIEKAGLYKDTVTTFKGCDSLVITELKVNPTFNKIIANTKCVGDSVKVGSTYIKKAGTYYNNLKTFRGCDSVFVYNLNFSPKPPTPVVTKTGTIQLTSSATAGNQWYDDNGKISGASGVSYTTNGKKGKYYVIVTVDSCSSDPSNKMDPLGINEKLVFENIDIYPNPVSDKLIIEYSGSNINGYTYDINSIQGQTMMQGKLTNSKNEIDVTNLSRGIYFIKIVFEDQIGLIKIFKE